ncbi:MAG: quinolinate synthase NadA [Chloroflexi bacterium]|nr:quinolinate synthase NadA [Chloroflexota bacterium]
MAGPEQNCADRLDRATRRWSGAFRWSSMPDSASSATATATAADLERRPRPAMGGERIPSRYLAMPEQEMDERIGEAKRQLGSSVVILGHHYQRDDIIKFADFRGDSYKLSQLAASRGDARYIVFCGVHFMAETADILSQPHQRVILPNLEAGCSMADMADLDAVEACWDTLTSIGQDRILPVTYMNSSADLKAFCGRHDGVVCTSSNAPAVYRWAFERADKILFFPDEHLGRNTGIREGIPLDQMVVWNPRNPTADVEALRRARVVLWKGFCSVHMRFNVEQIHQARAEHPGVNVLVHPECRSEVVQAADFNGSTEYILKKVTEAATGTTWAVGTEINMVSRLARENPDKRVFCLNPIICPCSTMYRIHPAYLCWVLESLLDGRVVNEIKVTPEDARWAHLALDRMLVIH